MAHVAPLYAVAVSVIPVYIADQIMVGNWQVDRVVVNIQAVCLQQNPFAVLFFVGTPPAHVRLVGGNAAQELEGTEQRLILDIEGRIAVSVQNKTGKGGAVQADPRVQGFGLVYE